MTNPDIPQRRAVWETRGVRFAIQTLGSTGDLSLTATDTEPKEDGGSNLAAVIRLTPTVARELATRLVEFSYFAEDISRANS